MLLNTHYKICQLTSLCFTNAHLYFNYEIIFLCYCILNQFIVWNEKKNTTSTIITFLSNT